MKKLLALTLIVSLTSLQANTLVDQSNVAGILDQMVREKVISAEEAEKAKIRMKSMDKSQWVALTKKAESHASRMPASINESGAREDLDGAQLKQIESDMSRMLPERR